MADPLSVQCPSCLAPPETACRTDHQGTTHADRQDAADLHAVEHGTCALCHRPMVKGLAPVSNEAKPWVPKLGDEVTAWHPDEADAAACPPLPDPARDWDAYARALQSGLAPGRPGSEHFIPADPAEHGRRLASERDDLIAQGVDPSELEVPLHPATGTPVCPDCVAGKHQNCTGEAWDYVADDLTRCTCPSEEHTRG